MTMGEVVWRGSKYQTYRDENVLWFDISVEYAMAMHMIQRLTQLVHVQLHTRLWNIASSVCKKESRRTVLATFVKGSTS